MVGPVPSTIRDGRPQPRSIKSRIAPHTTALPQAEPVTVHAVAGPARTTGESSLLPIFSISLEPSFSHGPTLANGRHIGFGGDHWDFSASFPQRYHTSADRAPSYLYGPANLDSDSARPPSAPGSPSASPGSPTASPWAIFSTAWRSL